MWKAESLIRVSLAELQEATANYAEAEATYEQALQNATGLIELRTRYEYGGFCLNQKEYSRAVELWRPLIRRENPNTLLEYYLAALYHSRFLSEAASIAADVKAKRAKPSALFAEIASSVYERLDDLREARHWLEYLCDISGNKPKYIAQLSAVHLRLGAREQALELLDATRPSLKSAADFMSLAQAYSILGKHRQASELAHKAVSLATDPAIHMAYLSVFMAAKECEPRTAEEIATFQDIMLNFKQRFPKSSQLQSFSIDPENPLATIRETLIKHSERVKTALQLYKERRLPLAMFARFIGKDIHDTWLSVVASPELVLHSATGTHEEAAGFARLLATGSGFVFEPVALFSFTLLGLLDKLPAIGDVYVAQRVLDLLHGLQAKRRIGSPSGTIGMIDGQFFMTEIAPDDITKQNAALDATTVWVETCAVPVGLKEPLKRADRKWLRLLGVPNVATIVIANQRGFVLVTDDKTLGDISKQNFGVSYVNTQAVLSYLLDRGVLCAEEYDRAVLSLVEHGYTFTRLHAHQILGVIAGEHFQLTPRLKRVLGALESPPADLISVSIVVADVIRQLYLEPIPDDIRNRLAFYMLDTIAKHQTKLEVQRLVRRSLRQQMSPLLMYQYKKIENLLDRL